MSENIKHLILVFGISLVIFCAFVSITPMKTFDKGLDFLGTVSARTFIAPEEEWNKTFGGLEYDEGRSVQQTSDGGYIITGVTESYDTGNGDIWLIKTDSNGNKQWDKTFSRSSWDGGSSVQRTSDGGYIIVGITVSDRTDKTDVWLIKTDSEGNKEWDKTFGGSEDDWGHLVQQTSDGGYIITGETKSYGAGYGDVWLIKTDSSGNKEWDKTFGGSNVDCGESVQQTSDGGYIITGETKSYGAGNYDVWLIKTDSEGNKEWDKTFGSSEDEKGYSAQQTSDGGYIITGGTISFAVGTSGIGLLQGDIWLIKTDSKGNKEWDKTFGGSNQDFGLSIQQTSDGGYIIAGWTGSYDASHFDVLTIKTDPNGNEKWNKIFGGSRADYGNLVQQTSDGGYIITGKTQSYGAGSNDIWLIKVRGEEEIQSTPTATPITPAPTKPTSMPTPTPTKTPAFEAIFAIAGLLAIAYLLRRKR